MEDWKKYLHQPKPVTQLLNDSIIVIDTNVLLAAYQWREVTVNEVLKALQQIKKEGRLRIPMQVIKEFSKNRTKQIKQRMNDLDQVISKLQKDNKPIKERVPMLEGKSIFKETEELQENYHKSIKEYKDGLIKLREHLKNLFYEDHFLDRVMEISEGTILLPEKNEDVLKKEAEERFMNKIPPGFKDSPKEENSAGDYIIWSSILQLGTDVVFVSGDKKDDWVYRDNNENPIVARRELIEEYFMKTGKDFAHITPKDFITSLNPTISDHVKEDLSNYNSLYKVDDTGSLTILSRDYSLWDLEIITDGLFNLVEELCQKNDLNPEGDIYVALDSLVAHNIIDFKNRAEIELVLKVKRDLEIGILQDENNFMVSFAIDKGLECIKFITKYLES